MSDNLKAHLKERKTWLRGLYMLLFVIFYSDYHPYPFGAWPKGAPKESAKKSKPAIEPEVNDDIKDIEQQRDNDGD